MPSEFEKELSDIKNRSRKSGTAEYADKKFFERFTGRISAAESGGQIEENASRDLVYLLEEKHEKLRRRGIRTAKRFDDIPLSETAGISSENEKYRCRLLFKTVRRKMLIENRKGKSLKASENARLYQCVTSALPQKIGDSEKLCCPRCGHVQKLKGLENACESCGESSFITDIFPRVSSCFSMKSSSVSVLDIIKSIIYWVLLGFVIGIPAGVVKMIIDMPDRLSEKIIFDTLSAAFYTPLEAALLGAAAAVFITLGKMVIDNMRLTPVNEKKAAAGKKISEFMSKYDRSFSFAVFESRMYFLAQLMIFSDRKNDTAVITGNNNFENYSIADVVFSGITEAAQLEENGSSVTIGIKLPARCVFVTGKKPVRKSVTFSMTVSRNIKARTDTGFEYSNIRCEACGEHFSALEHKNCPYCSMPPDVERHDWTVKSFAVHSS